LVLAAYTGVGEATDIPTGGDRILRIQSVVDDGKTKEPRNYPNCV